MKEILSHGYKTSKDYEKLFELIKVQRVVCFVTYKIKNEHKVQDVCESQSIYNNDYIEISSRGVSYICAMEINGSTLKEDFIRQCKDKELEFIEPTKNI